MHCETFFPAAFLLFLCILCPPVFPSEEEKIHWDAKYATSEYIFGTEPSKFLKDHITILPRGKALDLAMGEGRNAIYLAQKGYEVDGVDISGSAVKKALARARKMKVQINGIVADLDQYKISYNMYDLIAVFYFLKRDLIPRIKEGLKPGGMIIYETYTVDYLKKASIKREYLLERNELLHLFSDYRILFYKEEDVGGKATASLVAQKEKH